MIDYGMDGVGYRWHFEAGKSEALGDWLMRSTSDTASEHQSIRASLYVDRHLQD